MRRLVTLGLVVVVLAAIWSAGWFALASWAGGQVGGVLARVAARGVSVDCAGRDIVGFPFAIRLRCGETALAERSSGTAATLAGLTGGASVFAPRTARVSLASPVEVRSPLLADPAALRWRDAGVDVSMALNGPQGVAFDVADLDATLPVPQLPDAHVAARSASGTLAPSAEGGTDAAVAFAGLTLSGAGTTFPPFDGTASAQISAPPRALMAGRAGLQAPLFAKGIEVLLRSGEARVQASGDLSVDAEGIADGTIALRIAGAEHLPDFIAALPPQYQAIGNAAAGGILAFGKPAELNGERASELVLKIERGRTRIGPVSVRVPRIPL